MDHAYEGNDTRELALDLGYVPVVPLESNRLDPYALTRPIAFKLSD